MLQSQGSYHNVPIKSVLHWKSDSNELALLLLLHCYVASLHFNMITNSASESFGFVQFRCYSISPFPVLELLTIVLNDISSSLSRGQPFSEKPLDKIHAETHGL